MSFPYLIDDTANGGTSLHGFHGLRHGGTFSECLVTNAHIKVEATLGKGGEIVQLHITLLIKSLFELR